MPPQPATPHTMPFQKYQRFVPVVLTDRTWPNKVHEKAPCGAASTCATATRR
ncbi:MAG: hypothetical protein R2694_02155 [Ilumatobacteraceae bacterium]